MKRVYWLESSRFINLLFILNSEKLQQIFQRLASLSFRCVEVDNWCNFLFAKLLDKALFQLWFAKSIKLCMKVHHLSFLSISIAMRFFIGCINIDSILISPHLFFHLKPEFISSYYYFQSEVISIFLKKLA